MLSRSIALALIPLCLFAACAEERTTVDATSAEDAEIAPDRLDAAASPDQGVAKADTGVSVGDDAEVDAGIAAPDGGVAAVDGGLPPDTGTAPLDASAADGGAAAIDAQDPFAPLPDESEGLVNTTADLNELLEHGALSGACQASAANPADRRLLLLCGKWMFFYETFGTFGIPSAIAKFLMDNFPEVGPGFSAMGMIEDPTSSEHWPLGLAPTTAMGPPSVAFTCGSCHFGRLSDGRYSVGAPNHNYDYGGQILSLVLLPQLVAPGANPAAHHPRAIARLAPMLQRLDSDRRLRLRLLLDLLPLLSQLGSGGPPQLSVEVEGQYASWLTGTMDFVVAPLPMDDHTPTITKILALWSIPRPAELAQAQIPHAMLGWAAASPSLEHFTEAFVLLGGGPTAAWPLDRRRPLVEYIHSLRPPSAPPADTAQAERGRRTFFASGCATCHDGPRGSGRRVYGLNEVGTDPLLQYWLDPELDGTPCCGITLAPGIALSRGVKSPRLLGMSYLGRFLHNGALSSLEELLCASTRSATTSEGQTAAGHIYGCDLSAPEKADLITWLRSH